MTIEPRRVNSTSLIDILDRILDKGLVVAGDIRISLANVELLTIRIRLLVCSIDKAEQIGLNWWRYDTALVAQEETTTTIARLESRIAELERLLALSGTSTAPATSSTPATPSAAPRSRSTRQRKR
ncbi:MAG TPA: gas vesicle protein GvpJ [Chloroflexota bacterium]|nr:gas vesicle protein GvpJ [Chloroflexota bacterium]